MATANILPKSTNPQARKPYKVRCWDGTRKTEHSFRTLAEARKFQADFISGNAYGAWSDPRNGSTPFVEYARTYVAGLDVAPGTRTAYLSAIETHLAGAFAGRTLAQVAQDHDGAHAFMVALRESGMSSVVRARIAAVIRGTLDRAVIAGKITSHRLGDLTVKRDASSKAATLVPVTMAQLDRMAAELPPAEALALWLMRGCGLRISEAMAVRFDAFREAGRVLRISEQQQGKADEYAPLKAKRDGQFRDVPVPAWLWEKVKAHAMAHGTRGYLFPGLTAYNFRQHFNRAARIAGLPPTFTPHQLRHAYASVLLAGLIPITDVARWLGRSTIDVTYALYSHFIPSSWERAHPILDSLAA